MAHEVLMPKLSSTMTEGTITVWLKNEGDQIEVGEAIFEVMTDKIAIEVEAYEAGTLLKKYIEDGMSAPVNSIIAYIGKSDESVPEEQPNLVEETRLNHTSASMPSVEEQFVGVETNDNTEKIRATPAARRLARECGILLSDVQGTGPKGRIQKEDVKKYQSNQNNDQLKVETGKGQLIPWSGMRKLIAERMKENSQTIPHVTMTAEVDMTKAVELRNQLLPMIEEQIDERLSYLEIIMKATMSALKYFPQFNAHVLEEGIQQFESINMGVAVAVPEGLVVPVIKNADRMGLGQLTKAVKQATYDARKGALTPDSMLGGTFTISSLGRSKVKTFTPIINAPEAAILGVGGMYEKIVMKDAEGENQLTFQSVVELSLSFDHRVADGAPAAAFLSMIVELLENPMNLLM